MAKRFPSDVRSEKVLAISDLKKCGRYRPMDLREEDGVLLPALCFSDEGDLGYDVAALFASEDALYAAFAGGEVRELFSQREITVGGNTLGAVTFCSREGVRRDYLFGEGGLTEYDVASGTAQLLSGERMRHAAIFRERLFLSEKSVLRYSAPLSPGKFDLLSEGSGEIPLSAVGGDILALLPYGDRLVLFRTHEILILRADANDYDFSFERVKFDGGEIREGSVQTTGRHILFQTERGLYRMEGKRCKRVEFSDEGILFPASAASASNGGRYFSAILLDGALCLLVYDPEKEDYFLSNAYPTMLAGNKKGVWMNIDGLLMRAEQGSGNGPLDTYLLYMELDRLNFSGKVLEGVTVAGRGSFSVTVKGANAPEKEYAAEANERIPLRHTLPAGKLNLVVRAKGKEFSIRSVTLHLREVGA